MFKICKLLIPALLLLFFCGCMSFDYVGQSFRERPEGSVVELFESRKLIPADKFRIIGRGVLAGPDDIDKYDRVVKLKTEARKHGADAVCIVSETKKLAGLYPRSQGEFASPMSPGANKINLDEHGNTWSNDSFDEKEVKLAGEKKFRKEFEIKVLFLKKIADFEAEMKKRFR